MNSEKRSKREKIQYSKNIWGWGGIVKTFQPLKGHFLPWSFSINLIGNRFERKDGGYGNVVAKSPLTFLI